MYLSSVEQLANAAPAAKATSDFHDVRASFVNALANTCQ